jgi:hypothetical protein
MSKMLPSTPNFTWLGNNARAFLHNRQCVHTAVKNNPHPLSLSGHLSFGMAAIGANYLIFNGFILCLDFMLGIAAYSSVQSKVYLVMIFFGIIILHIVSVLNHTAFLCYTIPFALLMCTGTGGRLYAYPIMWRCVGLAILVAGVCLMWWAWLQVGVAGMPFAHGLRWNIMALFGLMLISAVFFYTRADCRRWVRTTYSAYQRWRQIVIIPHVTPIPTVAPMKGVEALYTKILLGVADPGADRQVVVNHISELGVDQLVRDWNVSERRELIRIAFSLPADVLQASLNKLLESGSWPAKTWHYAALNAPYEAVIGAALFTRPGGASSLSTLLTPVANMTVAGLFHDVEPRADLAKDIIAYSGWTVQDLICEFVEETVLAVKRGIPASSFEELLSQEVRFRLPLFSAMAKKPLTYIIGGFLTTCFGEDERSNLQRILLDRVSNETVTNAFPSYNLLRLVVLNLQSAASGSDERASCERLDQFFSGEKVTLISATGGSFKGGRLPQVVGVVRSDGLTTDEVELHRKVALGSGMSGGIRVVMRSLSPGLPPEEWRESWVDRLPKREPHPKVGELVKNDDTNWSDSLGSPAASDSGDVVITYEKPVQAHGSHDARSTSIWKEKEVKSEDRAERMAQPPPKGFPTEGGARIVWIHGMFLEQSELGIYTLLHLFGGVPAYLAVDIPSLSVRVLTREARGRFEQECSNVSDEIELLCWLVLEGYIFCLQDVKPANVRSGLMVDFSLAIWRDFEPANWEEVFDEFLAHQSNRWYFKQYRKRIVRAMPMVTGRLKAALRGLPNPEDVKLLYGVRGSGGWPKIPEAFLQGTRPRPREVGDGGWAELFGNFEDVLNKVEAELLLLWATKCDDYNNLTLSEVLGFSASEGEYSSDFARQQMRTRFDQMRKHAKVIWNLIEESTPKLAKGGSASGRAVGPGGAAHGEL